MDKFVGAKAGYARVSTGDQDLDLQLDALRREGIDERAIFTDKLSGSLDTAKRPGLAACLRFLRRGDVLIVWKLDRLARSLPELIRIMTMMQDNGIELKVLTQQIDTTTAMGKLIFYIFGALAEMERDLISERTKAGLASARARGAVLGRSAIMTPDREEQAVKLLASGISVEKAAEQLKVSRSKLYAWRKVYRERLEAGAVDAIDETGEVSR